MEKSLESPESPCTGICTLDAKGAFCLGCRRTLSEIAGWSGFSAEERRAVISRLASRGAREGN
ncbi:DUF1289 domain-containing protein [Allorhizobium sp. BGMRC 0089]|uniref:DUF1289 domain-containing protein n=1 Tax=Allorhizobium sonneratiae TaxID=2934936 RepID=UPI002034684E|nr:DUF1289 domain-containing protein [Allorhizobium sonneratiae]MCM2292945.1 DUF1289 domain-containing protein [Allorhizobium sonneratiae]